MSSGTESARRRGTSEKTHRPPGPPGDETEKSSDRLALAGLCLSILLASLGASVANAALPTLALEFAASFQAIQWILLSYLLAGTLAMVGVGRLGDLYGRRRSLLAGILLFTFASALCAAAPTLWTLIAARALQGLGGAVMMALALALVAEAAPNAKVGSAMGLLGAMSAAGTAIGPSLGGLLIVAAGWRAIFLLGLPIGALAFALARRLPGGGASADPGDLASTLSRGKAFDLRGTVLLAVALGCYALALTLGHGRFGAVNLVLGLAAIAAALLFLLAQSKTASPLIRPAMLRLSGLGSGLATSALVSTVMMATLVVGPFYLARAFGLGPGAVGLALSAGPIGAALSGLPAGRAVDRFGTRPTMLLALAAMAVGCFLLAALPAAFGPAFYVTAILLLTSSYALFQAANNKQVMAGAPAGHSGLVSSMLNLSRSLGLITGAAAMGALFMLASGAPDIASAPASAVARGIHATFAVGALLILFALAIVRPLGLARALAACKAPLAFFMPAKA